MAVTRSMTSLAIKNRTPERVSMLIRGEDKKGCCLEPLKASEEDPSGAEEGLVNCPIVAFPGNPSLRWDEKKTPVFFGEWRGMWFRTRKMLTHALQSPFCSQRLRKACIWGGVYASLFEYKDNVPTLKAVLSFWNRSTHTFLTRTGEIGYSLLDISEIAGIPTYERPYDEYVPQSEIIDDQLLKDLVAVHQAALHRSTTFHNKKKYYTFTTWVEEFVGLEVPEEFLSRK